MRRRAYLLLIYGGMASITGCISSQGVSENQETTTRKIDFGVILNRELENLVEEQVTLAKGQTITVEVKGLSEGDELFFTLGDGAKFVVREHIYENGSKEFTVESDGWHNITLSPKRHEVPMNEEVIVYVTVRISDP